MNIVNRECYSISEQLYDDNKKQIMASLNGWINGIYDVKSIILKLEDIKRECAIQFSFFGMNGNNCVSFYYDRNHYGICFDKIKHIFTEIAKNKDSYGVLYIQDDESKEYHNSFQVFIARKGSVEKVDDPYFSPCSEKIFNYDED